MARFGARFANYSHGIRDAEVEHYATGKEKVLTPHLEAQFEQVGLTDEDADQLARALTFTGLPFDTETESQVNPRSRMSIFDSREAQRKFRWSDEDHELVVKRLRESEMKGIEFIELESVAGKAPWAGYDSTDDVEKLVALVELTGTNPEAVLAYERANRNRKDVIEALSALVEDDKTVEIQA